MGGWSVRELERVVGRWSKGRASWDWSGIGRTPKWGGKGGCVTTEIWGKRKGQMRGYLS